MFQPAPREHFLDAGKAVGRGYVLDQPAGQRHVARAAQRQRGVARLGRRHQPARGRVIDRGGVEAGAGADHQPGGAGGGHGLAPRQHRLDRSRRKIVQRHPLRLQVVEHLGPFRARHPGQRAPVHFPADVGQPSQPAVHGPGHRDRGPGAVDPAHVAQILGQDVIQPFAARHVVAIRVAADGVGQDLTAACQGRAGVGAADVRDQGQAVVGPVLRGAGSGRLTVGAGQSRRLSVLPGYRGVPSPGSGAGRPGRVKEYCRPRRLPRGLQVTRLSAPGRPGRPQVRGAAGPAAGRRRGLMTGADTNRAPVHVSA